MNQDDWGLEDPLPGLEDDEVVSEMMRLVCSVEYAGEMLTCTSEGLRRQCASTTELCLRRMSILETFKY